MYFNTERYVTYSSNTGTVRTDMHHYLLCPPTPKTPVFNAEYRIKPANLKSNPTQSEQQHNTNKEDRDILWVFPICTFF